MPIVGRDGEGRGGGGVSPLYHHHRQPRPSYSQTLWESHFHLSRMCCCQSSRMRIPPCKTAAPCLICNTARSLHPGHESPHYGARFFPPQGLCLCPRFIGSSFPAPLTYTSTPQSCMSRVQHFMCL